MNYDELVQGVDISHWNGAVDFAALVEDGIGFVYIKATQGMGTDPRFLENKAGAIAAGLVWMPYPFLTASDDAATVANFKAVVGSDVPAVLDWETAGVDDAVVETWIKGLERTPLAYYGIDPPDAISALIATCPRILPEYAPAPRLPAWDGVTIPPDWTKEWLIWQRSDQATFQGEDTNFDLDVLGVPMATFKKWYATGSWT